MTDKESNGDLKGEKGDQVRICGEHFIGVHIHKGARRGISKGHG